VLAPDRRLGLTLDAELGVFRLAVGAYEGERLPRFVQPSLLVVARGELEPWGPVGRRTWPEYGGWTQRFHPATGLSGAYLLEPDGLTRFALGADLAFAWRRLAVDGEVLYAQGWPLERPTDGTVGGCSRVAPGVPPGQCVGAFLEALALLWRPYLSIAARGEYVDEDLSLPGQHRFVALAGGVNVRVLEPLLQLQISYSRKIPLARAVDLLDVSSDALIVALTLGH
jgi:hypothetical protein